MVLSAHINSSFGLKACLTTMMVLVVHTCCFPTTYLVMMITVNLADGSRESVAMQTSLSVRGEGFFSRQLVSDLVNWRTFPIRVGLDGLTRKTSTNVTRHNTSPRETHGQIVR